MSKHAVTFLGSDGKNVNAAATFFAECRRRSHYANFSRVISRGHDRIVVVRESQSTARK